VRGRVRHLERHVARIARDAARLGLGDLDPDVCRRALTERAAAAFAEREGVVRLEAHAGPDGALLAASARPLGTERATWRAITAPGAHPGPSPTSTAKRSERGPFDAALARARAAGADEALLLDADGWLVEGARSSLVVVLASGALVTPPLARGAQAGIGRALLLERSGVLAEADVGAAQLASARELVAVNAVRGPRPVVALDGRPVGSGAPGPWSARLAACFAEP